MTVYVYGGTAGCKPGTGNMGNMENLKIRIFNKGRDAKE